MIAWQYVVQDQGLKRYSPEDAWGNPLLLAVSESVWGPHGPPVTRHEIELSKFYKCWLQENELPLAIVIKETPIFFVVPSVFHHPSQ